MTIKVLVVDDSALIRSLLGKMIESDPEMSLVGMAADAYMAKDMVNQFRPDVITLDIEMPKVDGLTFLDRLMKARPTAVVMISALTEEGADATFNALALGAVDFIPKPKLDSPQGFNEYQDLILEKIKSAARAKLLKAPQIPATNAPKSSIKPALSQRTVNTQLVAIGASTGGTEAILYLLQQLPAVMPPIVITQHMPAGFTRTFAERLNKLTRLKVKQAEDGEKLLPCNAYVAPGDMHLEIIKVGGSFKAKLSQGEKISGHRPSVDVLFNSVAQYAGANATAVILTGMGKDGADGMEAIAKHGGKTFAQGEQSCVVFGMPKEAIKRGVVHQVVELPQLADKLLNYLASLSRD
ncbi:protein-glutamate methylesterase/protein-glutamine glutaminase [Shewanella decolorationis]|uniref:Protein-glutamate methylesterase/protein-glutamine glutaminase n=1 Tax=Shewanella decolorationis S12 TaxID=1353536 RepID=A0ABN0PLT4_9GAMM|nr:chemotaxis response regulator protein-glutamate methylesterase [Shewanella decolorationis]ESE41056.1 response regulator receiver modulated methylesterase [Shewanella decolorationis S12]GLR30550.1 chemotaxis response regulator protein-glutamate methylesterase of group 2 operon [Shewanella decolorationis]